MKVTRFDRSRALLFLTGVSLLCASCLDRTNHLLQHSVSSAVEAKPSPPPVINVLNTVASGSMVLTATGLLSTLRPSGRGMLIRRADNGTTEAHLHITGLPVPVPSTVPTPYMAHVHALPCSVTDGGGHYKIDPS